MSTPSTNDPFRDRSRTLAEEVHALDDAANRLQTSDLDAAIEHARAAVALAERVADPALLAQVHYTAGCCTIAAREFDHARDHYLASSRHWRESGNDDQVVRAEIGLVHVALLTGALDDAARMLIDLEPAARRAADPRIYCSVLNNLGNIFDSLHQPQRAIDCFTRSIDHARSHDDRHGLALALNNLGGSLAFLGELDRAFGLLRESIEVYREIGKPHGEALASGNLALVLERQGDIQGAIDLHRRSLERFEMAGDQENIQTSLTLLAGLEQQRGSLDEAVALLSRALSMIPEGSYEVGSIHAQLSRVYEALGDAPRALLHYRRAAEARQQIDAWVNSIALHELQRHVVENEELQDEQVRALISQRDRAIAEQAERAGDPATGGPADGAPAAGAPAGDVPVLDVAQQAEIVVELRRRLLLLETPLSDESRRALEALLDELDSTKRASGLERLVDAGNRPFLQKLSARCPTLTPAELRVCSLLRDNLSTKEIAQLLNVSERNIESHRYSVRRKLALDTRQQLATWLAAL